MVKRGSGFVDDISKIVTGVADVAQNMKHEAESLFLQKMKKVIQESNNITREEFEIVFDMATKARLENEKLEKRVIKLEASLMIPPRKSVGKSSQPKKIK